MRRSVPVNYTYKGVVSGQLKVKRLSPAGFQQAKTRICINSRMRCSAQDGPIDTARPWKVINADSFIQELEVCCLFCRSARMLIVSN